MILFQTGTEYESRQIMVNETQQIMVNGTIVGNETTLGKLQTYDVATIYDCMRLL